MSQLSGSSIRLSPNTNSSSIIRVVVWDEDAVRREGLQLLINHSANMRCIAVFSASNGSMSEIACAECDVLLLHIKLGGTTSFDLIRDLAARPIHCKILAIVDCVSENCPVLSRKQVLGNGLASGNDALLATAPDDCLQIALKLGASGVIRNPSGFAELSQAIETVVSGKYVIEYPVATRLAMQYLATIQSHKTSSADDCSQITLRERQVLMLIAHGSSNKDIAREMQISYSTVKNYVSNLLRKLKLGDRTQLAIYAVETQPTENS